MRLMSIDRLKGDEILGKHLYDDAGRILLSAGVQLTSFYVDKLKGMGIYSLYIDDEVSREVVVEESITEQTRQAAKSAIKDMMARYNNSGKASGEGIVKSVNYIIDDILDNKDVLMNVSEIRSSDDNLYSHSINVCVLSTILGVHMGYNQLKLKELAVGAILHDVGVSKILGERKELEKRMTRAEFNEYVVRMHPKVGYDMLSGQDFCSAVSKVAVLMHHEKMDGSGYPLKLKSKEIHEVAKIVGVCDAFDNMINGKSENGPMPVYQVLEYLTSMGMYFDADIVRKFTMNIAAFATGSGVQLNTGEKCLVVRQNKSMPVRPVVKVLYDRAGQAVAEPFEIDLLKELTIFIAKPSDL